MPLMKPHTSCSFTTVAIELWQFNYNYCSAFLIIITQSVDPQLEKYAYLSANRKLDQISAHLYTHKKS